MRWEPYRRRPRARTLRCAAVAAAIFSRKARQCVGTLRVRGQLALDASACAAGNNQRFIFFPMPGLHYASKIIPWCKTAMPRNDFT